MKVKDMTFENMEKILTKIEEEIANQNNEIRKCEFANYEITKANNERNKEVKLLNKELISIGYTNLENQAGNIQVRLKELKFNINECNDRFQTNKLTIKECERKRQELYSQQNRYSRIEQALVINKGR